MNSKKIIVTGLVIGLLGINYMPLSAHAFAKRTVIKTQVSEYRFDYVNLGWWENYNDEILKGYIVKAVNENQDLKIATLKVEEAEQNVKVQFAKELPSASIGASPSIIKNLGASGTSGLVGFPALVSYEADIFLKNHEKTKSVKKLQEISKINERAAYLSIVSAVGSTYFNIVKLDKLISVQQEIVASREQIYNLMKKRNAQGITSTADLLRADKALVMATVELIDLEKARNVMLNQLAVLICESPENIGSLERTSYDDLVYKGTIPEEIPSSVITKRPDYLIAEKQVEKAGIDVKVAKKEFLPKINILGLLMLNITSANSSLSWANTLAGLGGAAMLPAFTGGSLKANLKLNQNKYEQVLQNYHKTNLVAIQEVNDNLSNFKLENEKYQKNLKALEMEEADFKYTEAKYHQGVISNLDLIQHKENLLVINKMVAASKIDCNIAQIGLYKAAGGNL